MNSVIQKINNLPKSFLVFLSFLFTTVLYWKSLTGLPVFDDIHYIFKDSVIIGDFPYKTIWSDFAWPLSVSIHKFIFNFWQYDYLNYHLLNLGLHFLNSILLLNLVEKLKLPFPKLIFFLFLIHPSNVISVSWMVQLKTLVCFTFAILTLLALLKSFENKKWYILSWISFALSILSKSASLPLTALIVLFSFKKEGYKSILWVLPIILMSGYSTYKVINSSVTSEGVDQLESKSFVAGINDKKETGPKSKVNQTLKLKSKSKSKSKPKKNDKFKKRLITFLKTSHYYFWQVVLPMENYPVKGQAPKGIAPTDIIHLLFLIVLIFFIWGNLAGLCLLSGYTILTPFLGIVPAPYMNLTWVSEQHLYLALPFFLCFWLTILSKWKFKYASVVPVIFVCFFSFQTYKASSYYKDEIIFYTKSLEASPSNIPIAYNLAVAYLNINEPFEALFVTGQIIEMSQQNRDLRKSKYLQHVQNLHGRIEKSVLQKP